MPLIIAYFAILSAVLFRLLHRKTFNPATIFLGVLGIQMGIFGVLEGILYEPLSTTTLLAASAGLVGFLLGYSMLLLMFSGRRSGPAFRELMPRGARRVFAVAIISGFVAALWHTLVGLDNISQGSTGIPLLDLRTVHLDNPGSFSLAPHLAIFAELSFLFLYIHGYRPRLTMSLFIMLTIYCAAWKMERSGAFMGLYSALVAFEFRRGELSMKLLLTAFVGVVVIFMVTAALRDGWDSAGDILFVLLDYFARNLQNFDIFVANGSAIEPQLELIFGKYTTALGAKQSDMVIMQDDFFNTHSYLKNVYLFGGTWFCLLFGWVLGGASAVFYRQGAGRHATLALLYCFLSFPLFLSFFDYAYSWTNWAYYVISAVLLKAVLRPQEVPGVRSDFPPRFTVQNNPP